MIRTAWQRYYDRAMAAYHEPSGGSPLPSHGWRYWRQKRVERDYRLICRNEWKIWLAERAERNRILHQRLSPAQVAHFRALDGVRRKEIAARDAEISRLVGLLRDAGLHPGLG